MKKVAFLLTEGFEETEFVATWDLLNRARLQVITFLVGSTPSVGDDQLIVHGSLGLKVIVDQKLLFARQLNNFDALVLPGGPGVERLQASPVVLEVVRNFHTEGKLVAAICAAPLVLADAGILQPQTNFTSWGALYFASEPEKYPGYDLAPETVVDEQQHIITSSNPWTAISFATAIIRYLLQSSNSEMVQRFTQLSKDNSNCHTYDWSSK